MRIVEFPEEFKKLAGVMAYSYEARYHGCSQALLLTFQELLGLEDELTLKAASALCSGVALMGHTCGALISGVMVMGMKYGRARLEEGIDGILRGMRPATRLVRRFEREFGTTACSQISGIDWTDREVAMKFMESGEVEKCCRVAARTAEMVAELLSQEAEDQRRRESEQQ